MLIAIPRSALENHPELMQTPWDELMVLASVGEHGMRQFDGSELSHNWRPRDKDHPEQFAAGWDDWDDLSLFRNGHGAFDANRPWLLQQNWGGASHNRVTDEGEHHGRKQA